MAGPRNTGGHLDVSPRAGDTHPMSPRARTLVGVVTVVTFGTVAFVFIAEGNDVWGGVFLALTLVRGVALLRSFISDEEEASP